MAESFIQGGNVSSTFKSSDSQMAARCPICGP